MIKDVFRLSGILLVICGLAVACVSAARQQTLPLIEKRQAAAISEGYKQVLPYAGILQDIPSEEKNNITAVKRSEVNGVTNGYIYTVSADGYSGKITLMLGIEHPSASISGVKILQQTETPGLGAKCSEPAFLTQFFGKNLGQELSVSKNASNQQEVQAITASTITSKAVVRAINAAREHYNKHFGTADKKGA